MPVFKLYYQILKKNLSTLIIYTGIFLALSFFMVSSNQSNSKEIFEEEVLQIGIVDNDKSDLSQEMISYLDKNNELVYLEDADEKLQDALYYRMVSYILKVPEGFEQAFVHGKELPLENIKVPGSTMGYLVDRRIEELLASISMYQAAGDTISQAAEKAIENLNIEGEVKTPKGEQLHSELPGMGYYFQYMAYAVLSLLITGFSPAFLSLFQRDNRKRMTCSSTSLKSINLQLTAAIGVYSLAIWGMLVFIGFIWHREADIGGNAIYILLNTFVFTLICMAIGFLVGIGAKSENSVTGITNIVGLSMAFLGGVFVPLQFLGEKVLFISRMVPTYWYVKINTMLFEENKLGSSHVSFIWQGIGIQLLFAGAIFAAALLMSKRQRTEA